MFPNVNNLPAWDMRLFCRPNQQPTSALADASDLEMENRFLVPPDLPRKDKALPGYGAMLFVRAVVQHFASWDSHLLDNKRNCMETAQFLQPQSTSKCLTATIFLCFSSCTSLTARPLAPLCASYPTPLRFRSAG